MVINKPFPSSPRPLHQNEVTCKCSAFDMEMIFHSQANKTSSQERLCTWPHFESEGFWNSKMAILLTLSFDYVLILLTRKSTFVPFGTWRVKGNSSVDAFTTKVLLGRLFLHLFWRRTTILRRHLSHATVKPLTGQRHAVA